MGEFIGYTGAVNARAMVLCAGLGSRLRPLTDELPKPLVPVGDRPLLAHIAAELARAGLERPIVNVHHLPRLFINEIEIMDAVFEVIEEPEIRGTAGGIAGARRLLSGSDAVLVWNGDVLTELPLGALLEVAVSARAPCLAVRPCAVGYGTVGLGADDRVVRLRGERFGDELTGGDYLGVCALPAESVAALPERGCLVGDFALPALRSGGCVRAVRSHPPYWFDVGGLGSYFRANLSWLGRHFAASAQGFRAPAVALEAGVTVSSCVLGRAARVSGEGELRRVVAWPGAAVRAPLQDAVVTSAGVVVPLSEA
jgi:mannose-1-phosphate guanylyltransferase